MTNTKQVPLGIQQVFQDKLLILTICLSITIGSIFWLLFPCYLSVTWDISPIILLNMLLVYPILEEWVFRGGIQEFLLNRKWRRSYYGVSQANLITSSLFAAFHLIQQPPLFAALVFLPSITFGFFKERYSALLVPIGLHILFNGIFLLASSQKMCE